jgi:hypothetical protein
MEKHDGRATVVAAKHRKDAPQPEPEVRPLRMISLALVIGELENRRKTVPVTFSFRGNLDIRHRLPDRMVKASPDWPATFHLRRGFYAPEQRVTAPSEFVRGF